jgi:ketosteroid isomerase-like protein
MTQSLDPSGDQSEIRQLVERYASGADRADGEAVAALFTEAGELEMWLEPASAEPASRRGHAAIAEAIGLLADFDATQHVISSSVVDLDGTDVAHGETRCTAHHVKNSPDGAHDTVLFITYLDRFERDEGRWRIGRRELRVQWTSVLPVESI